MSVHRKSSGWVVRYRDEAKRHRSRTFTRKADAERFDVEVTRRRQLGVLPTLMTGGETLNEFVAQPGRQPTPSPLDQDTKALRQPLRPPHRALPRGHRAPRAPRRAHCALAGRPARRAGAGPAAVSAIALELLGGILERAVELERIPAQPSAARAEGAPAFPRCQACDRCRRPPSRGDAHGEQRP